MHSVSDLKQYLFFTRNMLLFVNLTWKIDYVEIALNYSILTIFMNSYVETLWIWKKEKQKTHT